MSNIARVWFGRTPASKAEEYQAYIKETGVNGLRNTEGNLGVLLMKRLEKETAEFAVISFWESTEAIKRFAGNDINKAVYYPEDKEFLLEMDPELAHYEVTVAEGFKPKDTGGF